MIFKPCVLQIKNLSFYIGANAIISDFSLNVTKGEIVAIAAPSGAGKSTLLNLVAGLKEPSGGSIKRLYKSLAYAFATPSLLCNLNAFENIKIACKNADAKTISDFLKSIKISEFDAQKYPGELSLGQLARINFARCMLKNSDFLLLDEPFSNLNYELRNLLANILIKDIKENKKSAIFITHDYLEALKIADVIYQFDENFVPQNRFKISTPQSERNDAFLSEFSAKFLPTKKDEK